MIGLFFIVFSQKHSRCSSNVDSITASLSKHQRLNSQLYPMFTKPFHYCNLILAPGTVQVCTVKACTQTLHSSTSESLAVQDGCFGTSVALCAVKVFAIARSKTPPQRIASFERRAARCGRFLN